MAFYKATMDLHLSYWAEAQCIIKADNAEEAIAKAKKLDFEDINIIQEYEEMGSLLGYDVAEGIVIEKI